MSKGNRWNIRIVSTVKSRDLWFRGKKNEGFLPASKAQSIAYQHWIQYISCDQKLGFDYVLTCQEYSRVCVCGLYFLSLSWLEVSRWWQTKAAASSWFSTSSRGEGCCWWCVGRVSVLSSPKQECGIGPVLLALIIVSPQERANFNTHYIILLCGWAA